MIVLFKAIPLYHHETVCRSESTIISINYGASRVVVLYLFKVSQIKHLFWFPKTFSFFFLRGGKIGLNSCNHFTYSNTINQTFLPRR